MPDDPLMCSLFAAFLNIPMPTLAVLRPSASYIACTDRAARWTSVEFANVLSCSLPRRGGEEGAMLQSRIEMSTGTLTCREPGRWLLKIDSQMQVANRSRSVSCKLIAATMCAEDFTFCAEPSLCSHAHQCMLNLRYLTALVRHRHAFFYLLAITYRFILTRNLHRLMDLHLTQGREAIPVQQQAH